MREKRATTVVFCKHECIVVAGILNKITLWDTPHSAKCLHYWVVVVRALVVFVVVVMSVGGKLCFVPPAGAIMTGIAVTVVPVPLNAVAGLLGTLAFEYDVSAGTFVVACVSCGAGSDCSGCVPSGASTD